MTVVGAAAVLGYAWWAVALPPFSTGATVVVVVSGVVAAATGWRWWRRRRPSPGPPPKVVPWMVLAAAVTVWQLAAYVQQPRDEHPTLSSLNNALLDSHPARAVAFVLWLAGAAWIARR